MTSPIDTAYVAIEPDFSGFGRAVETGIGRPLGVLDADVNRIIQSMESEFDSLTHQIEDDFNRAQRSVDASFDEMRRSAATDLDSMGRQAESSGNRIGAALGKAKLAVAGGALALGAGIEEVARFGLTSAANLEQVQIAFDSLTGSVAKGETQFNALQKFAAATPFSFDDLTTSAQRFDAFAKSVGLSQNQLIPFETTIGNLVSETGGGAQSLNSISLAFGQMASAGKLSLDNINQINDAIPGFNSVAALAQIRGETTAQVMDEISKGTINASTGVQQLLQGMDKFPGAAGAMEKQSKTLLGVFSTLKDTVSQALVQSFKPILPVLEKALGDVTPVIEGAIKVIGPALGQLVASVIPLLSNLLSGLAPIVTPILKALTDAFKILGPVLPIVGQAIGQILTALEPLIPVLATLLTTVVTALVPVISALAPVLIELVGPISDILVALSPLIPPLGELLVAVVQLVEPLIKLTAFLSKFITAKVLIPIVSLLVPLLSDLAKVIGAVAEWISKINWGEVGDAIVGFAEKVGGFFVGLWDTVLGFFEKLPGQILGFLEALPSMLGDLAIKAFHAFFYAVGFGIGLIIKEFIAFPGQIWALVKLLWDGVVLLFTEAIPKAIEWVAKLQREVLAWFASLWTKGKARFERGVDDVVDFAKKLPGRVLTEIEKLPGQIWGAVKGAASWLWNTGRDIVNGLIGGIKSMIGSAIDTIKNAMGDILHGAEDALGIGSPSKLFMEIGHNVIAGYNVGVEDKAPSAALATMRAIGPPSGLQGGQAGTQGSGGGALFGPNSIVVVFQGVVPTQQEALATGHAVGQGIASTLAHTQVRNTVRTM